MKNGWTGGQYSIFRILLGLYLLQHFLALVPWGTEAFSNRGALPVASASPLIRLFPNVLAVWDQPVFVAFLLALGALLSAFLTVGFWDRPAAVSLWYLWACLLGRNPLISNPALPFIGWLLLLHAVLPKTPYGSWAARSRDDPRGDWYMPQSAFALAWVLLAAAYCYSGYAKLASPSWVDGSAFAHVLENPLARPTALRGLLLAMPPVSLRIATWAALALELTFAPLALLRRARPWIWTAMVGLHAGLLLLVSFADLTAGMLLVHLFTFNPAWLRASTVDRSAWIFYEGTAPYAKDGYDSRLQRIRTEKLFGFHRCKGVCLQRASRQKNAPHCLTVSLYLQKMSCLLAPPPYCTCFEAWEDCGE